MPRIPGEELRKVTLNLYEADVAWLQERYGWGYSEQIRSIVRSFVNDGKYTESDNRHLWKWGPE